MGVVVVGVDDSPASLEALRWAAREARCRDDVLRVVTAWDDPARDMWVPSGPPGVDPLGPVRASLERTVEGVLGDHPVVTVETTVVRGRPAAVLTEASRGAELLVVGNRGRGGLTSAVLGSVSATCAAHAPCPVVIVRADASASPGHASG
jgi:nucleotide-binding universal stress UspA family protein